MEQNFLYGVVSRINKLPQSVQARALSLFFGQAVKFAGTAGIRVEKLTESEAVLSLPSRRRIHNHIQSIHAVATALIAESATGYLVAMNLPDTGVPVIKTLHIDYVKRVSGDLRAVAHLTDEQIALIRQAERGEVIVPVTVTDSKGVQPVKCQMTWAWTPKIRTSTPSA